MMNNHKATIGKKSRKSKEEVMPDDSYLAANLFEIAQVIVLILDTNGKIVRFNPYMEELSGYRLAEVQGKDWFTTFLPERDRERIRKIFLRAVNNIQTRGNVNPILTKDRRKRMISWYDKTMKDSGGKIIGLLCVGIDITKNLAADQESRQVHKELQEGEERYSSLIESSDDPIYLIDREGKYLFANRKLLSKLGKPADEIVGRDYSQFHSSENTQEFLLKVEQVYKTGNPVSYEHTSHRDGREFIRTLSPVINPNTGAVTAVTVISKDITERKQAQELTRLQSEIILNMAEGVVLTRTRDGMIVYTSPTFEKMFGYGPGEMIGKNISSVNVPPEKSPEKVARQIQDSLKRDGVWQGEVYNIKKDGEHFWCYANISTFKHSEYGDVWIATHTDITKRKRAEENLLRSEMQYRTLTENSPDLIARFDRQCRHLYVNKSAAKAGHFSPEGYIGKTIAEVGVPEEEAQRWEDHIRTAFETGQIIDVEDTFKTPNGLQFFHTKFVPEFAPDGTILSVQSIARDITKSKQAEEALRINEAQLSTAMEISKLGYWEYDVAKDLFTFNDQFYDIFHTTAENVGGYQMSPAQYAQRFLYPDDQKLVAEEINKALETTDPNYNRTLEHRVIYADGEIGYISVRFFAVKDKQGRTIKTYGSNQDITEWKKSEEELKSAHEYSRNLIDSSLDMIIATDKERRIVEFNKAAQDTFGYDKAEILNKPVEILFANPAEGRKTYNTIRRTGRFSGEIRKKRKNGEEFISFLSGSVIHNASGEFLGVMSISRDITKVKQSEKEKESLQMQLLQSQKMEAIGTLASGIAHDFNNLLTIILGHGQLASGRLDEGDPTHKDLEKIIGASERAAILTRQLLIFSRKQVLETKVLNLNVMVTDTDKLLKRLIGEDIKIIPELETGLYQIKADRNQIEQILMNLIVNARDSIPKGGTILIKTQNVILDKDICKIIPESLPGKFVRLTVEDSGTGMDDEVIKHLFEPFFTTKKDGTGLGLAVVYGIAKQHNGWINVYSEPGHGSTFKVYFPAFFAAPEEEVEKIVSAESLQGNGERILVVEDEEYVRQFASAALREYGYIVFEVTCGKDAQRIFENETGNFDLIFSDVVLPDKDGLQLVDELLKVKPDLRVLLSSGYSDYKSQWDEIKNRIILFLQKPYGITDLLKSVKNLMQSREQ